MLAIAGFPSLLICQLLLTLNGRNQGVIITPCRNEEKCKKVLLLLMLIVALTYNF